MLGKKILAVIFAAAILYRVFANRKGLKG